MGLLDEIVYHFGYVTEAKRLELTMKSLDALTKLVSGRHEKEMISMDQELDKLAQETAEEDNNIEDLNLYKLAFTLIAYQAYIKKTVTDYAVSLGSTPKKLALLSVMGAVSIKQNAHSMERVAIVLATSKDTKEETIEATKKVSKIMKRCIKALTEKFDRIVDSVEGVHDSRSKESPTIMEL